MQRRSYDMIMIVDQNNSLNIVDQSYNSTKRNTTKEDYYIQYDTNTSKYNVI